jgi:hypothetical protein
MYQVYYSTSLYNIFLTVFIWVYSYSCTNVLA